MVGLGSIFVLLNFVVPRFALIFSDPRMKIPTPTLIMLEASKIVQTYWLPAAIVLAAALIAFQATSARPPDGCGGTDSACACPLLGDALRKAETARFARAMATLVAASVPLVQSLGISRGILNNRRIAGIARSASPRASSAAKASRRRLPRAGEFPPLAGHLLASARKPGTWTPCSTAWPTFTTPKRAAPSGASLRCLSR